MAKVTSKLQVTIPKALAERYHIRPGDQIEWEAAGRFIRIVPPGRRHQPSLQERLQIFDKGTRRLLERQRAEPHIYEVAGQDRGWTRGELYERGSSG